MSVQVDVWLRGSDFATTATLERVIGTPAAWGDDEVKVLLEEMLRAMHRLKNPDGDEIPISLRGLSWIVNPFEDGGVVIAIEITLGAAVAGPFHIQQAALEGMIARVLSGSRAASPTVH